MAPPDRRRRLAAVWEGIAELGATPGESGDGRLHRLIILGACVFTIAAVTLMSVVYWLAGAQTVTALVLGHGVALVVALALFARRRIAPVTFGRAQAALGLLMPFLIVIALGGLVNASVAILWSLAVPAVGLIVLPRRDALVCAVAWGVVALTACLLEPWLEPAEPLAEKLIVALFVFHLSGVSTVTLGALAYFIRQRNLMRGLLRVEQAKSEALLRNVLPSEIVDVLRESEGVVADQHEDVSVLFADIVGFTPLSERMPPDALVALLNEIFSEFDALAQRAGVEKIKTIGDCYMVAAGVPRPRDDHARAVVQLGLDMQSLVARRRFGDGRRIELRVGVNSGPVVAGVIGRQKFAYDLWGDVVNTASRLETHGLSGAVQMTRATRELVRDTFECELRGTVEIKGKGPIELWLCRAGP